MTMADLVAFLDADDVWVPDKLQRQVEALPQDEAAVMVFGSVVQFTSPGSGRTFEGGPAIQLGSDAWTLRLDAPAEETGLPAGGVVRY
jgi:hypothetical protein